MGLSRQETRPPGRKSSQTDMPEIAGDFRHICQGGGMDRATGIHLPGFSTPWLYRVFNSSWMRFMHSCMSARARSVAVLFW